MNRTKTILLFLLIGLVAFIVRFYQLGNNPPALDWDEASIGYNAYTILKTGRDEYGNFLPLSIRSFNDYKASVYTYLTAVPIAVFGLNEFSIRFVSAFFGSLTVGTFFFIFRRLLELDSRLTNKNIIAMVAMALLAINPWHIQFSRVAFEANLALFFVSIGFLFLLKHNLTLAIFFWGISLFTYHAEKIFLPLFITSIFIIFKTRILKNINKISLIISFIFIGIFLLLILRSSSVGGQSRFLSSSIFSENKTIIEYGQSLLGSYLSHFDINFLFIQGDTQIRHHAPGVAQLLLLELPLVIIGAVSLLKFGFKGNSIIFLWLLLGPLPAAIGKDSPNAVRSLLMIPMLEFISAWGMIKFLEILHKPVLKFLLIILLSVNSSYYLHVYFNHLTIEDSQNWQYGYKQMVNFVNENQDKYKHIVITNAYDQPYIYFLLYQKPTKILFNNGEFYKGFDKYVFRPINWDEDRKLENTLLVASPKEIPIKGSTKEINFLNGETVFKIVDL